MDALENKLEDVKEDESNKSQFVKEVEEASKLNHKANRANLDEKTIVGSALSMLVAGYDSSSHIFSFACYYMATQPGNYPLN